MSVFDGSTEGAPAPHEAPAPAPAPAAPPAETVSRAEFERLQQENAQYRQKFQPYERAFKDLDPGDAENFLGFVETYKAGNADRATEWLVESAKAIGGNRFEQLVRGGATVEQAAEQVQVEVAKADGLTPDQMEARIAQLRNELRTETVLKESYAVLEARGIPANSPLAAAAFAHATDSGKPLAEALEELDTLVQARATQIAEARSRVGVGPTSPNGRPAVNDDPNMSTKDKFRAAVFGGPGR